MKILYCFVAVTSVTGYSWQSHQAVAYASYGLLTDSAKEFVQSALQVDDLSKVREAMVNVSSWADGDDVRRAVKGSDGWHFYNAPAGFVNYASAPRAGGPCLITALAKQVEVALDPEASAEALEQAVKFLVHLAADLHQPLHVGRAADDGGNAIKTALVESLTHKLNGKGLLHKVWDLALPEYASLRERLTLEIAPLPPKIHPKAASKEQKYPRRSSTEVGADLLAGMAEDERRAAGVDRVNSVTVQDQLFLENLFGEIATAVHHEGLATAYNTADQTRKDTKVVLDAAYFERNLPVVQRLLRAASMWLAQIINSVAEVRHAAPASAAAPGHKAVPSYAAAGGSPAHEIMNALAF